MSDVAWPMAPAVLRRDQLDPLLDAIRRRGFRLVGPVLKDGAICYDDISSAADLPAGWTDEQDAATYRVRRRDDQALFGPGGLGLVRRRVRRFEHLGTRSLGSFVLAAIRRGRDRNRLGQGRCQRNSLLARSFRFGFPSLTSLVCRIEVARLSVANRDLIVVGMYFAKS